jgi:hypothetical protein
VQGPDFKPPRRGKERERRREGGRGGREGGRKEGRKDRREEGGREEGGKEGGRKKERETNYTGSCFTMNTNWVQGRKPKVIILQSSDLITPVTAHVQDKFLRH